MVEGLYIKMKLIEQSDDGTTLAICYQDDGAFHVLVVSAEGSFIEDINVTKLLHLDRKSKPVEGFWEPGIVCSFLPGEAGQSGTASRIMICVYHRYEFKQYHFVYSLQERKMTTDVTVSEIKNSTYLNFPVKSFYSGVLGSVFVYYRQGHCFTIDPASPKTCRCEKITD